MSVTAVTQTQLEDFSSFESQMLNNMQQMHGTTLLDHL
jgi:hypothetical protein